MMPSTISTTWWRCTGPPVVDSGWRGSAAAETAGGRALEHFAVGAEARAVERAVPALLGVVPAHDAAEVCAHRGDAAVGAGDAGRRDREPGPRDVHLALALQRVDVAAGQQRAQPAPGHLPADLGV